MVKSGGRLFRLLPSSNDVLAPAAASKEEEEDKGSNSLFWGAVADTTRSHPACIPCAPHTRTSLSPSFYVSVAPMSNVQSD